MIAQNCFPGCKEATTKFRAKWDRGCLGIAQSRSLRPVEEWREPLLPACGTCSYWYGIIFHRWPAEVSLEQPDGSVSHRTADKICAHNRAWDQTYEGTNRGQTGPRARSVSSWQSVPCCRKMKQRQRCSWLLIRGIGGVSIWLCVHSAMVVENFEWLKKSSRLAGSFYWLNVRRAKDNSALTRQSKELKGWTRPDWGHAGSVCELRWRGI